MDELSMHYSKKQSTHESKAHPLRWLEYDKDIPNIIQAYPSWEQYLFLLKWWKSLWGSQIQHFNIPKIKGKFCRRKRKKQIEARNRKELHHHKFLWINKLRRIHYRKYEFFYKNIFRVLQQNQKKSSLSHLVKAKFYFHS